MDLLGYLLFQFAYNLFDEMLVISFFPRTPFFVERMHVVDNKVNRRDWKRQ